MINRQPGRRAAVILAFLGGLAALVLCLLLLHGTETASGDAEESGSWAQEIESQFSILETATPESYEGLSRDGKALLASQGPLEALGEARYEGNRLLVTLAGGNLCAIDESADGGGGFCGGAEEALAGQLVTAGFCGGSLPTGEARLFGVMPDGVQEVSIASVETEESVEIVQNTYVATVPAEDTSLSAADAKGNRLGTQLPLAGAAAANGQCAQH